MNEEKPPRICFPKIKGVLVDLRELTIDDAMDISHLTTHDISKSLWQVSHPYTVQNALTFINSSH